MAVLLFAAFVAACASGPGDVPIRVMVYNIHAGKDPSGIDNLERVAALIGSHDADLVLLQEVDRRTARSGNVDQVDRLAHLTKRHAAFGKSLDYQGGEYGIAILSRWPIRERRVEPLRVEPPQSRAGGSVEPRVALVATIDSPAGPLHVLNTHLDASREDRWRLQEVDRLVAIVRGFHLRASFLAGGDFNAEPGSAPQQRLAAAGLRDAWPLCGSGNALTYPAGHPVKRIDYLFLPPEWDCASGRVVETEASDHRPLVFLVHPRKQGTPAAGRSPVSRGLVAACGMQ